MTVLIVSGTSPLAEELARLLEPAHTVGVLADGPARALGSFARAAGGWTLEALTAALDGVDAVVDLAGFELSPLAGAACLDTGSRRTYNLCLAATARKIKRYVYVSSLELLAGYDRDLILSEQFRALPSTEPWPLGLFLGEQVVREAIREDELPAVIVRLGRLVREEEVAGQPFDPFWVDPRDAALVIERLCSFQRPRRRFRWLDPTIHVGADRPDAASPPQMVRRWMQIGLRHPFAACPEAER